MARFKKVLRQGFKKVPGMAKTTGINIATKLGDKALKKATFGGVNVKDIQKLAKERNPTKIGKGVGRLAANTALKGLSAGKFDYKDAATVYKLRNNPKGLGNFAKQKAKDIGKGYANTYLKNATGGIVDYQAAKLATQRGGLKKSLNHMKNNTINRGAEYATGGLLKGNDATNLYQNRNNPQALAHFAANKGLDYAVDHAVHQATQSSATV